MKVLHVIPSIAWRYGGTSSTIRALCGALAKHPGIEIELATSDADGAGRQMPQCDVPSNFPVHVFPRTASERWKYSARLGSWLRSNVRKFDIVHVHGLWSYASSASSRAARRSGVPYIIRPAGMLSNYTFHHNAWMKAAYWKVIELATLRGAAAVHATSHGEKCEILRKNANANVYVIPNGVDSAAWNSAASAPNKRRHNGDDGPLSVLFLSRLHPKKGITDVLLPAWSKICENAELRIAGGADEHAPSYAKLVENEIQRLGLSKSVTLFGPVAAHRRWELYDAADLFVLPSHSENFGIVVAEAMARGCAVVVSDQVQASEHVRQAGAGLVTANEPSAVAAALNQLLSDSQLRYSMGDSGRRYAQRHFNWDRVADSVRYMYEQVIPSKKGDSSAFPVASETR